MKTEGHITPTRTVIGVDTRDYPFVEVDVLVEFDPSDDPTKDHGERYFSRKRLTVEGRRFAPTHHHQRALILDAVSRIFRAFSLDAQCIGVQLQQEIESGKNSSNEES